MKKNIFLSMTITLVFLLAGLAAFGTASASGDGEGPRVTQVRGEAFVYRGGGYRPVPVYRGMIIGMGDVISTEAGSSVSISYYGKDITIGELTMLSINSIWSRHNRDDSSLNLIEGTVRNKVHIQLGNNSRNVIRAANTIAGVRGTEYILTYSRMGLEDYGEENPFTRLTVIDGTVRFELDVENDDGEAETLTFLIDINGLTLITEEIDGSQNIISTLGSGGAGSDGLTIRFDGIDSRILREILNNPAIAEQNPELAKAIEEAIEKREELEREREVPQKPEPQPIFGSEADDVLPNLPPPAPEPEPTPQPPSVSSTPAPQPTPAPTPAPTPRPTTAPGPTPAPEPAPAPTPETTPTPAPTSRPSSTPAPAPTPKTDPIDPPYTLPTGLVAYYGQTLSDITLPFDAVGTWAWVTPTDLVGDIGSMQHAAVFTPDNTALYKSEITDLSITVNSLGTGVAGDPYIIYNETLLRRVGRGGTVTGSTGNWNSNAHYLLIKDITLQQGVWTPIPDTLYGTFNGGGHIITGLTVSVTTGDYAGMFTALGYSTVSGTGTVENLGLANVNVSSGSSPWLGVGALAGSNGGIIRNCFVDKGSVSSGAVIVGGLVGRNIRNLTNCWTDVSVTGQAKVGGIAGMSNSTLENCYALGSVTADSSAGGIVGSLEDSNASNLVALNSSVTATTEDAGRVIGVITGGTASFNYANAGMGGSTAEFTPTALHFNKNGADIDATTVAAAQVIVDGIHSAHASAGFTPPVRNLSGMSLYSMILLPLLEEGLEFELPDAKLPEEDDGSDGGGGDSGDSGGAGGGDDGDGGGDGGGNAGGGDGSGGDDPGGGDDPEDNGGPGGGPGADNGPDPDDGPGPEDDE